MRYLIAAALVVSPLMLNAQTVSSAQNPRLAAMESSLTSATLMMSSASAADRTPSVMTPLRVSTGVVEPKLVHTVAIRRDTLSVLSAAGNFRTATLSMVVDEDGKPSDVKIVKSAGPDLDAEVLQAVSQYRFQPATVSGKKVAMSLNLHMEIQLAR